MGVTRARELQAHFETCLTDVVGRRFTLPDGLLNVGGLCSLPGRTLWARLARGGVLHSYLEVGVLHGAMFCCALTGDLDRASGIDNFSQFNGQEAATRANLAAWRKPETQVSLHAGEAFQFQPEGAPFDWYYYDAGHTEAETAQSLTYYMPSLADPFLFLADDYNDPGVQAGVARGLAESGLRVEWSAVLTTDIPSDFNGWWAGIFAAVLSRG